MDDRRTLLRTEVGQLRLRESRRRFPTTVCVGVLGGGRRRLSLEEDEAAAVDTGLRTDLVARLVEGAPAHWRTAWLERPGGPEPHDADAAWHAAAWRAFGLHDRALDGFFVLTRSGWADVRSGEHRTWVRLRL